MIDGGYMSSIVLPSLDLSAAVVGVTTAYDFSTIIQSGVSPLQYQKYGNPHLQLYNESPVGLMLELAQSKKQINLPAGGWATIDIGADDKGFTWKPLYILLNPAAVNQLLITYLPPGDAGTDVVVLGNSPINGVVTTGVATTANELQGIGQTKGVTEIDDLNPIGGGALTNYDQNAILIPMGSTALHGQALELASKSIVGATELGIIIAAGLTRIVNTVYSYDGITTAGLGVPAIYASSSQTGITGLGTQTIATFTPTADGFVRGNLWFRINNGGAATITALLTYNDGVTNGARTNPFTVTGAAGTVVANAAVIGNGFLSCLPLVAWVKAGTPVTITYRDSTNTPNDAAFAVIEQLA